MTSCAEVSHSTFLHVFRRTKHANGNSLARYPPAVSSYLAENPKLSNLDDGRPWPSPLETGTLAIRAAADHSSSTPTPLCTIYNIFFTTSLLGFGIYKCVAGLRNQNVAVTVADIILGLGLVLLCVPVSLRKPLKRHNACQRDKPAMADSTSSDTSSMTASLMHTRRVNGSTLRNMTWALR